MTRNLYIALFLIGILVHIGVAALESGPGYMDADYYYANGLRIATIFDWKEPYLWNYLSDPVGIPQSAFTYWMPLTSLIVAAGVTISGSVDFNGARLGFLVISGLIPVLTARLSVVFTAKRWAGMLSGLLAVFSGFYLPYLPTTETFGLTMLLGGAFFLLLFNRMADPAYRQKFHFPVTSTFAIGLLSGLIHLARADGILWLLMALAWILVESWMKKEPEASASSKSNNIRALITQISPLFLGYLIVIGPWFGRNLFEFGTLFSPGSSRALWIARYDELFVFPATVLTFERWLSSGIGLILSARTWALGINLQTAVAVQGAIFLTPLVIAGIWAKRDHGLVRIGVLTWMAIFLVMTVVFPFPGARGGFFHSGSGIQPLYWALVPVGLDVFTSWGEIRRGWNRRLARRVFAIGLVLLAILLSVIIAWQRIIGRDFSQPQWGETYRVYANVDAILESMDIGEASIVMVNNPPGYYGVTGRRAIVIPDGDLDTLLAAGSRFQASYLLLDENSPKGLLSLYTDPGDRSGLRYLRTIEEIHVYELIDEN